MEVSFFLDVTEVPMGRELYVRRDNFPRSNHALRTGNEQTQASARKKPTSKSSWAWEACNSSAREAEKNSFSTGSLGGGLGGRLDLAAQILERHFQLLILEIGFLFLGLEVTPRNDLRLVLVFVQLVAVLIG